VFGGFGYILMIDFIIDETVNRHHIFLFAFKGGAENNYSKNG